MDEEKLRKAFCMPSAFILMNCEFSKPSRGISGVVQFKSFSGIIDHGVRLAQMAVNGQDILRQHFPAHIDQVEGLRDHARTILKCAHSDDNQRLLDEDIKELAHRCLRLFKPEVFRDNGAD